MQKGKSKTTSLDHAKHASYAHTTLCIFGTIEGILEQNNIRSHSAHKTAEKIIKLCREEQQRQLTIYDREMSHVG